MKKLKNTMKRIATLGLTAVLLTNSFPAAAFAAETDGTEPAIVMDTELPENSEEVFAGEGDSGEVLSENFEEISEGENPEDKGEGAYDKDVSSIEKSVEENDITEKAVTPSTAATADDAGEDGKKDSLEDKEEYPAFEGAKSIDGVKISVKADEGVFPEGATLSVEKVNKEQEKEAQEAVECERDKDQNVAAAYTFDIKVLDKDSHEIEPADQSMVKVSFTLDEVSDSNLETNIYHITENTNDTTDNDSGNGSEDAAAQNVNAEQLIAEKLTVETDDDTATAETDSFSLYTVEFTYNDLQYVLPGDSSIELSEILDKVGLTGEVSDVVTSDESLFSAEKENGEWVITAHQAFSSTEWMKVTINDVVYEITVTDTAETSITTNENVTTSLEWSGDYAVNDDVIISGTAAPLVQLTGDTTITIAEGKTLTVNGYVFLRGGDTPHTLTINGSGAMVVESSNYSGCISGSSCSLVIGGAAVTLNGATGDATVKSIGITVNSGSLTVTNSNGNGKAVEKVAVNLNGGTFCMSKMNYESNSGSYVSTLTVGNGLHYLDTTSGTVYAAGTYSSYSGAEKHIDNIDGHTLAPAYSVSVTAPTNGTLAASGGELNSVKYNAVGATVTLTATPDANHILTALTVGGEDVTASVSNNTYTFTMPDADVTVAATFTPGGSCGVTASDNVTWAYDETSHTLTISGTGAMADYNQSNQPWKDYKSSITTVSINEGVTNIGNNAFNECTAMTTAAIPASVESIGFQAFILSSGLTTVTFANGSACTSIGYGAFNNCRNLANINLPADLESIGYSAFNMCALTSIDIPAKVTSIGTSAFESCSNLATVNILGAPTMIGNEALNCGGSTANGPTVYALATNATDALDGLYTGSEGSPRNLVYICAAPAAPTTNSFTYDGTEKTVAIAAPTNCGYTLSDNKKTYVGSYTATATLNEGASKPYYNDETITKQYVWGDITTLTPAASGSTDAKEYAWSIAPKTISGVTVTAIADQTYTGSAIEPAVTVRDGTKTLVKDTDYTVAYSNNTNAEASTAAEAPAVTITGKGNYSTESTKTANFTILPKSVTVSGITANDKDYDGTTAAALVCTNAAFDGLVDGDNLTVTATGTFADANAGENKTVNITGLTLGGSSASNYKLASTGNQTTTTATIRKISSSVTTAPTVIDNLKYTGSAQALINAGSATGGTIYYAVTGTNTAPAAESYTTSIPTGTSAGSYYVWYKVVGDDNHNNTDPAGPISVEIGKATLTSAPSEITRKYLYSRDNSDSFTLTGLPEDCGAVTWKNPSKTGSVSYTTDPSITQDGVLSYTVGSGELNTNGTITVVAETQNYEDVTFTINIELVNQIPVKLKEGSSVSLRNSTLTYGQALSTLAFNTAIFVSDDAEGKTVAGTLAWKEPDTVPNAGTTSAAWIFTPTDGAYASLEGTVAITVNKKNISGATVTLGSPLTYNGSEQTQSVSKVELSGTDITEYCEISGNKGTNAGSYTLTVTAKADSNYTGSATKSFTIAKKSITPTVTISGSYSYTGSAITPTVSVKDGSKELASTDYSISVTDNINAGKGKVTVSAKSGGNYSFDAKTVNFDINKAAHNDETTSAELKYGLSGSVELASLVAPGATCEIGTVSDAESVLSGTPSVTGTVLSFGFKAEAEVGKTSAVTLHVKNATNYLDYDITATLTVIDCAHEHTEIRDAKAATCTEQGYTGDTYCTECGKKISSGTATPIDPDNHAYDAGVITKQPTILEEGIKTYTCIRCHHTYTETVPRVDDGEDHSDLINDVTDNDGNTKAEVKTEQKDDGSTETTVTVGDQEVEKTVKDADGNETIQTQIWVGGLSASYHYTGSAIKPAIHVYDGTKKLKSGTDYSVSYKNNTKVGTNATITISFKGNYKGTAKEKVTFAITPAVLGEDVKALDLAVAGTGKTQKPAPALVWTSTGKTVSGKNFSFAYKDAAGNDVSGVKGEGTYTVAVTPKNGSFTGSTTAKITVTSKKLLLSKASVTLKPNKYTYTGDPIIPANGTYTLKLNGAVLTENTDYVVESVTNNTNAGTATITFAAKEGNAAGYVGTRSATFKIVKGRELKQGDGFTYSHSSSVPYAKGGAKPSVIVKDEEDTLVLNKDYTVSYSKNTTVTNGATAILTVKGKGNYKGSVKLPYAVTTQNIANLKNGITVADKLESGKGFKNPSVTIIDLDGKKLKAGTDFKIGTDYSEPDADGKVTVTVLGNGKYNGSIQVSYRYIKVTQQISKTKAMKNIAAQTYTGKAIRLKNSDLTGILYTGNKKNPTYLVPGVDFVVLSYSNNTKAGTAKVTLKGIGNYGSTKTLTFKIKQKKGDYKGALVGGEWTNTQ